MNIKQIALVLLVVLVLIVGGVTRNDSVIVSQSRERANTGWRYRGYVEVGTNSSQGFYCATQTEVVER